MNSVQRIQKVLPSLILIFLIGMTLQFVAHTIITFSRGLDSPMLKGIWARKELFLVVFAGGGIWAWWNNVGTGATKIWQYRVFQYAFWIWIVSVGLSYLIAWGVYGTSVVGFLISARYTFFPLAIILIGAACVPLLEEDALERIKKWFILWMKILLIGALVRYVVIWNTPKVLMNLGYTTRSCDGEIGKAPPAVYRTNECYGFARNQFVFERPTSRGFFLVAFWPLFYLYVLKGRKNRYHRYRAGIYGLNMIVTFSRAAWGAWILEILIIGLIENVRHWRKYLVRFVILGVGFPLLGALLFKDRLIQRGYSDTGHIALTVQALKKVYQRPLQGRGPGSAGPASYQIQSQGYNPENQFLQIRIEYGIVGFLGRIGFILLFVFHLLHQTAKAIFFTPRLFSKKNIKHGKLHLDWESIALGTGLLGLLMCGLVLHSFSDRMVTYPFFLIIGMMLGKRVFNQSIHKH